MIFIIYFYPFLNLVSSFISLDVENFINILVIKKVMLYLMKFLFIVILLILYNMNNTKE